MQCGRVMGVPRLVGGALLVGMQVAGQAAWAAAAAEYAFRWLITDGGPQSALAAAVALDVRDDPGTYEVEYVEVSRPPALPEQVKLIARNRKEDGKKPEATYKLRSSQSLVDLAPSNQYACPLQGGVWEAELDVSWAPMENEPGKAVPIAMHSRSCSTKGRIQDFLPQLYVKTCPRVEMTRYNDKSRRLKVEQWTSGQRVLVEVSRKVDTDNPEARQAFENDVVAKLLKLNARPTEASKSDQSKCP
jgi:hypothetical protein